VIEHRTHRPDDHPRSADDPFLCRAISAFPSLLTILTARVAQVTAGATHVFARVRQIFMSHTLNFCEERCAP
jgi:hypothetical protein